MKQFRWPLEKLFEVTQRREDILRLELMALEAQARQLRQQIEIGRREIGEALTRLGELGLDERLRRQAATALWAQRRQAELDGLHSQVDELARRRGEVMRRFLQARSKRQGLEKLRGEALGAYRREADRIEQNELEEAARSASAARRMRDSVKSP